MLNSIKNFVSNTTQAIEQKKRYAKLTPVFREEISIETASGTKNLSALKDNPIYLETEINSDFKSDGGAIYDVSEPINANKRYAERRGNKLPTYTFNFLISVDGIEYKNSEDLLKARDKIVNDVFGADYIMLQHPAILEKDGKVEVPCIVRQIGDVITTPQHEPTKIKFSNVKFEVITIDEKEKEEVSAKKIESKFLDNLDKLSKLSGSALNIANQSMGFVNNFNSLLGAVSDTLNEVSKNISSLASLIGPQMLSGIKNFNDSLTVFKTSVTELIYTPSKLGTAMGQVMRDLLETTGLNTSSKETFSTQKNESFEATEEEYKESNYSKGIIVPLLHNHKNTGNVASLVLNDNEVSAEAKEMFIITNTMFLASTLQVILLKLSKIKVNHIDDWKYYSRGIIEMYQNIVYKRVLMLEGGKIVYYNYNPADFKSKEFLGYLKITEELLATSMQILEKKKNEIPLLHKHTLSKPVLFKQFIYRIYGQEDGLEKFDEIYLLAREINLRKRSMHKVDMLRFLARCTGDLYLPVVGRMKTAYDNGIINLKEYE